MESDAIRILCVDDNPFVSDAIERRLRHEPGFEWLGRLESADELVAEVGRLRPHVVLLDIDMPGKDSFEALEELSSTHEEVRTVMLSGYVRPDYIDRAVEAGAWGYLSKNERPESILASIRNVAAGEFTLGPEVREHYSKFRGE